MTTATILPTSVLTLAGSKIVARQQRAAQPATERARQATGLQRTGNRLRTAAIEPRRRSGEGGRASQRPPVDGGIEVRVPPHAFEVGQRPAWRHQRGDAIVGKLAIGAMRDRADDQVVDARHPAR